MFLKIGIDLGTANTNIYFPGKGIVITEPTIVAYDQDHKQVLAVGKEAKEMVGRTPGNIIIYRPLKEGVIADYKATKSILEYFLKKIRFSRILKPILVISVPAGITSTEEKAIKDAAMEAGAREVYPIREPLLAALGAELNIHQPTGNMIVNIGGGTTEIAVISLDGIVGFESIKVAGDKLDESIKEYLKRQLNLAIGEQTAEAIKIKIGSAIHYRNGQKLNELSMEVKGVDLITGLPKVVKISANQMAEAIQRELKEIINAIKKVLANTPPELVADIMENGIVLSGGVALLRRLDELISQQTGVKTIVADDPLFAVARGTGKVLEKIDLYRKVVLSHRR